MRRTESFLSRALPDSQTIIPDACVHFDGMIYQYDAQAGHFLPFAQATYKKSEY